MASPPDEASITIGIDFGTTYSGVAWTCSGKTGQIDVITSWDSKLHSNQDKEKTPTAIHYGSGKNWGRDVSWGYDIEEDKDPLSWFKLLLIDEDDLPADVRASQYLAKARERLRKENRTTTQVASFYLRYLWNHSIDVIIRSVGKTVVNYSKLHVVVTVPAIWPQYARSRMREAMQLAGVLKRRIGGNTTLDFISEPEAAALATIADTSGRVNFQVRDSFVVADCGGGTADIISYKVCQTGPVALTEIVEGQGSLCGAIFADEAFAVLLENKFGRTKWQKLKARSKARLLHDEWENGIKSQYDGGEQTQTIDIPFECLDAAARRALKTLPTVELKAKDIRAVFDTVVEKISRMITWQISQIRARGHGHPKYLILVGGFGRCRYLQACLVERLRDLEIEVLQSRGGDPWSAVCRGAVIHGVNSLSPNPNRGVAIRSRMARANYGICFMGNHWDPHLHRVEDKEWCEVRQCFGVTNQMQWFLRKGEDTGAKTEVRHKYHMHFETPPEEITEQIYVSTAAHPSKRRDSSVHMLADIKWDGGIDFGQLPTYTNPIKKVYILLIFEIAMTCTAGSIDFAIYHEGKRQGSKNVVVDFDDRGLGSLEPAFEEAIPLGPD